MTACLLALGCATPAQAHFFTQPYTLPVPFAMYAWGSSAALVLSFVLVGLFASAPNEQRLVLDWKEGPGKDIPPALLWLGRAASVMALGLAMVTGWFGTQSTFDNLNMTMFWIVFVLCVPYLTAIVGDFYAAINPWRALVELTGNMVGRPFSGLIPYPARLHYWPALLFYAVFIWLELFGHLAPLELANALAAYTALNFAGAWAFGVSAWFRYGEFFGVFLRLIGAMAPVAYQVEATGEGHPRVRVSLRPPFSGVTKVRAESLSFVLFILFMLSSTAYDGIHATEQWVDVYWGSLYPLFAPALAPAAPGQIAAGTQLYPVWETAALLLSPFFYLSLFLVCIVLAKHFSKSNLGVGKLTAWFAPSLIPIAFVYHVTHYYTILLSQGPEIVRLVSDPFGFGWDLFGTAKSASRGIMIEVDYIWHSQVALILLGHIVSVYLAHVMALRVSRSARSAAVGQLPMLALMVLFTTFGLWILSLPLAAGAVGE